MQTGRRPVAIALVAVALLAIPVPSGSAAGGTLGWDYDVDLTSPADGRATVTITLSGVKGSLASITFLTDQHAYPVTNVSSPTSVLTKEPGGHKLEVKEDVVKFRFTVDVRRKAVNAREYNAYLGAEWGVFRAEAFALPYNYLYYSGSDLAWNSRVRFSLPEDWRVEAPWTKTGETAFSLAANDTLPRGFVGVGVFKAHERQFSGEREFRFARLGNASDFEANLFRFLAAATPYYESVYGPSVGKVVFVVSAPAPMFKGGLGAPDSFYLRDGTDLRTVSHEYAHVWQLFGTRGERGVSSLWLNEGDADYHSALALFATDEWSLDKVNDLFKRFHEERREAPFSTASLVDATYGSDLEDLAYHKGALVLHALDRLLQEKTGGTAGVADLLQALNRAHDPRAKESDPVREARRTAQVTNEEILETANRIAGADLSEFFALYVHGTHWPEFEPVTARGAVVLTDLALVPAQARRGDPVIASVTLVNRGLSDAEKRVTVTVDGAEVGASTVALGKSETRTVNFTFTAGEPGPHEVRALYLKKEMRVILPPSFAIQRISNVPATPIAGQPFDLLVYVQNAGEDTGTTLVNVYVDDRPAAPPQQVEVSGGVTKAVSFSVTGVAPGEREIRATVPNGAGGTREITKSITFAPPARVPADVTPAPPEGGTPALAPAPGALLLGAAAVSVALALGGRRA